MYYRVKLMQDMKYTFQLKDPEPGTRSSLKLYDEGLDDVFLHIEFEQNENAALVTRRTASSVQEEGRLTYKSLADGLFLTFRSDGVLISVDGNDLTMAMPGTEIGSIAFLELTNLTEPANLLSIELNNMSSDFSISSLEYTILSARLSRVEKLLVNLTKNVGQPS